MFVLWSLPTPPYPLSIKVVGKLSQFNYSPWLIYVLTTLKYTVLYTIICTVPYFILCTLLYTILYKNIWLTELAYSLRTTSVPASFL